MESGQIIVYGAHWCPDCRRSKQFLGEHQIPYTWVDIEEDPQAEQLVIQKNGGKRIVPTIVFADGDILAEPSNARLAQKLGLKTKAQKAFYDLIVVGGGPAGLTAALYTARESIDTLVIERAAFGGQAAGTEKLDNMPGFPEGVAGIDFANRLRQQAERFGVELLQAKEVTGLTKQADQYCLHTDAGEQYCARAVLLATGSRYKKLDVPGESDFLGAGVHFCATCDGPFYKGMQVVVVGGGNSATEESLLLTKFARSVILLVRGSEFKATRWIQDKVLAHPSITVRWNTEVMAFMGAKGKLDRVKIFNKTTGAQEIMPADGVFIFIGLTPNTGFLWNSPVRRDSWGFVITGPALTSHGERPPGFERRDPYLLETSLPGVFAAGDVRDASTKQVVSAAGEGSTAALEIRAFLKRI
jgi:thioredoxin reductase (NADPH)